MENAVTALRENMNFVSECFLSPSILKCEITHILLTNAQHFSSGVFRLSPPLSSSAMVSRIVDGGQIYYVRSALRTGRVISGFHEDLNFLLRKVKHVKSPPVIGGI